MKFYYLHVLPIDGSIVCPPSCADQQYTQLGLIFDSWQRDDLSCFELGRFFVTERLRSLLEYKDFSGLKFTKVTNLEKGGGFLDKHPGAVLPSFYWLMEVQGIAGKDDFGIFYYHEMVVSQKALDFLRDNHVTHAEADEITVPLAEYFDSPRKYFWMQDERIRQYFIDMDNRRKKQMPDGQER
jgi:hypothetical protein